MSLNCGKGILKFFKFSCASNNNGNVMRSAYLQSNNSSISELNENEEKIAKKPNKKDKKKSSKKKPSSSLKSADMNSDCSEEFINTKKKINKKGSTKTKSERKKLKLNLREIKNKDKNESSETTDTTIEKHNTEDSSKYLLSRPNLKEHKNKAENQNSSDEDKVESLLSKYNSRDYVRDNETFESDNFSSKASTFSENTFSVERRRKIPQKNRHSKIKELFKSKKIDESESEICFIIDFYDKIDLNNNLKEKMFEVMNQRNVDKEA